MITWDGSKRTVAADGLATMAQQRLRESGLAELTVLDCDEDDGVLRLRGTLSSSRALQHALALVAAIPGLRGIDNRIVVAPRERGLEARRPPGPTLWNAETTEHTALI